MDQLIASLPARVVAIAAIVLGFLFFMLNDPPKTVCDIQLEVFQKEQEKFLYPAAKGVRKPEIDKDLEMCRLGAGPGGCFELFRKLRKLAVDIENIPRQCTEDAAQRAEIRKGIWGSLKLMVMLAWGERPPLTYVQKNGWLDASDVALYCRLKQQAVELFGREAWMGFRDSSTKDLPGAAQLTREQIWQRSLISTACENYR
ncbi:MAG: hypothetical protein NDI61_03375 [Bdellovibrionaceae bacterium]|nr:hypothetical protein [Pseudobdellovibrionaceae bacterium]